MYEIIANPEEYTIGALEEGLGHQRIAFPDDKRQIWAEEIGIFSEKLDDLSVKTKSLQQLLASKDPIMATPASIKNFKKQLFKINDALNSAIDLAKKLEAEIVKS